MKRGRRRGAGSLLEDGGGRAIHRRAGGAGGQFDDGSNVTVGRFGEGGMHGCDEVRLRLRQSGGGGVGQPRRGVGFGREVWRARREHVRSGLRGREVDSVTAFRAAAFEEA